MRNHQGHYQGELTEVNLAIIPEPLGWVTVTRVYVRKRDGEVNKVEIEIVEAPILELFFR